MPDPDDHDDLVPSTDADRSKSATESALLAVDGVVKEATRRVKRQHAVTQAFEKLSGSSAGRQAVKAAGTSSRSSPMPGDRFGRFTLTQELGRGFSSVVFKAHHTMLDIDVALKVLLDRNLDEAALQLVFREAHILATLNHPGMIRILDFDRFENYHVVILEYVDGLSLRDMVEQQGCLKQSLVIDIVRQVAAAMLYAHSRGVVHNDIKPANILLTKEGGVKVADLGMAKVVAQGQEAAGSAQVCGTPAYISPEMVTNGMRAADHRSDIYSLGVSMYQCLTGKLPFDAPDPYQLLVKHVHEEAPPLTEVDPTLDLGLATLVACMMSKRPEDRPQSYDQLIDDLAVIQESVEAADDDSHMELIFDQPPAAEPTISPERASLLRRLFKRGK